MDINFSEVCTVNINRAPKHFVPLPRTKWVFFLMCTDFSAANATFNSWIEETVFLVKWQKNTHRNDPQGHRRNLGIPLLLKVNHPTTSCLWKCLVTQTKPKLRLYAALHQSKDLPGCNYRGLCLQSEEKSSKSKDSLTANKNKMCLKQSYMGHQL